MPRKRPRKVNIIDLESTCWEPRDTQPEGEYQEIIEIGIAVLNMSDIKYPIEDVRSILVKPTESRLTDFCTDLTTITPELLDKEGIPFVAALDILKTDYKIGDRTWCSWGDFDRKLFEKQCGRRNIKYPFGPRHINLKNLYSVMNNLKFELGMPKALENLGIELEGTHHRGVDDARNIAKIARHMFSIYWLGEKQWREECEEKD